jgi:dTDP-4-dehydrorhamnose reductase
MRIAVIGRNGQVASALAALHGTGGLEIVNLARPELDLREPGSIGPVARDARPDVIINAAAWTAVDDAEARKAEALQLNAVGAGAVAEAAARLAIPIIHFSTDYVFDGRKASPYVETDQPDPATAYGMSKLAGEHAVAGAAANHAILRVAWLHAPAGRNFVRTMLRLAQTRNEIGVVADQIGNPTSAQAVAEGAVVVARNLVAKPGDAGLRGVFHMTCAGEASWADFAEAIFAGAAARGMKGARVRRIATAEYPTPAARPPNSRLDCGLLAARHGVRLPHWQVALDACLDTIAAMDAH